MSANKESNAVDKAMDLCTMVQSMIDFTAKHLYGLRTQCATTEEITQSEIRDTESKLIKLFSKQLVAKAKLATDDQDDKTARLSEYPHTEQWLTVVGLRNHAIKGILARGVNLDSLLEMSDEEVRNLLLRFESEEEDMLRLNMALKNLKFWTEKQLGGDKSKDGDVELHWTSYKQTSNSPYNTNSPKHGQRPSTSSLPPDTYLNAPSTQLPTPPQSTPSSPVPSQAKERYRFTPPPTPPLVRPKSGEKKYISTPPPKKKMTLLQDVQLPLTKSKSHESQLASRVIDVDNVKPSKKKPHNLKFGGSYEALPPRCPSNEGSDVEGNPAQGHPASVPPSPLRSPPVNQYGISSLSDDYKLNTLTVPRSPKAPFPSRMMHSINHRFNHTFKITTCDYCRKQMFIGFKCKECKFKCHRDCAIKAPPSCALPNEYVQVFINSLKEGSPNAVRRTDNPNLVYTGTLDSSGLRPVFHMPDSSSNTSSCNSSTPSSPALGPPPSASVTSPSPGTASHTQFEFPEIVDGYPAEASTDGFVDYRTSADDDIVNTNTSNDSDKTLVDSSTSEKTLPDRVHSLDSQDDPFGHNWNRQNSLSVTLKEWDIPFEDVTLGEDIGTGRFGTVYRGHWHGDVAIKMLKMDPDKDNQAQMSAFKLEVAMLRKTRHDNLVLFMGACMKPPHLAIVTSLCKGKTLYTHIHTLKEKFAMSKTVIIASQIAQGMGYLHARGIVHKDLKTKNIFLERDKVIITDFGLFNVTKLCGASRKGNWLSIPPGWLCYLSPEIICSLQAGSQFLTNSELPFTEQSDVYAFGTVWYELLTGEWPFKKLPAETIIWQVGRGLKQSLSNVQASRDVKDILMVCWTYKASDRPDFSRLLKALERLPKKRLLRSPSHPVHLSRSAESVI